MNTSLRLRLVVIILTPLLVIAGIIATLAVYDAQLRANARFDRSLLSAVLSISRDVALSGGDALSPETNTLLQDTSGGRVYYHVYAPDGVFVTGYATPPVPKAPLSEVEIGQTYYDSTYKGDAVRVLRFTDVVQIDGLSGTFTFTVWQETALRSAIVSDLSRRTFGVIATLVLAVALVVWFGVRLGLRPLLALEAAIARRSPDDLTAIRRSVPAEARGIVSTLNRLFGQVSSTLEAKDVFISNAAHQLRNPIAGVVAMSDAVRSAKTLEDMRERSKELGVASRRAGDLANKLLALERASSQGNTGSFTQVPLATLLQEVCERIAFACAAKSVTLNLTVPEHPISVTADATMLSEAITNLIENALIHAGPDLSRIDVSLASDPSFVAIRVQDNGCGFPPQYVEKVRERFGQVRPSAGSGLGLAIADAVAKHHNGALDIAPLPEGLRITLRIKPNG
jgi:two-component system sensor histidine kinase TctE